MREPAQTSPRSTDPDTDTWDVLEASPGTAAQYPLLFLLPDGNIFYAGSELANPAPDGPNEGFYIGRVMDMNTNPPTWLEAEFPSRIPGCGFRTIVNTRIGPS